jgi:anti-anti-sigma regulatory factor
MSDVDFVDAQSIGLIVQASTVAQHRGRVLRDAGLHGLPARVFRLVGLGHMLVRHTCSGASEGINSG